MQTNNGNSKEKRVENKPTVSELRMFFDYSLDLLVLIGFDGAFKQISPSFERTLGWKKEDVLSKPFLGFLHPDDRQSSAAEAKAHKKGKDTVHFENRYRCKDGSYKWISWSAHPLQEKQIIIGIGRDITERKKAEHALLDQKNRAEQYLNIVGSMILALNVQGKITLLNKKGYEILGYKEGELHGKDWFEICLSKETRKEVRKFFEDWVQGKAKMPEHHENDVVTKYGEKRIVRWHNTELKDESGQLIGTLSSGEDITERKKAETAQKASEERLKMAQRIAHLGSWEFNIKEDKALWSNELFHIFNLTPQLFGPNTEAYRKFIHPDDDKAVNQVMSKFIFEGHLGDIVSFDYRIILTDGTERTLHTERMIVEVDEVGKASKIMGIEQDITERKIIEKQLEKYSKNLENLVEERTKKMQETEQSYHELYESFDEAFIAVDWELNVIHWNKAAERVTTIPARDALGKKVYEVLPEMMSVNIEPYYETLQAKKPTRFMMNVISRETGKPSIFEISTYPSTQGIIIIVEDKTEEEQIKRLSTIGQTAGMVGHDIRNPLQAITNELYLTKQEMINAPDAPSKTKTLESVSFIQEQINYIDKIVSDLQDYAKTLQPVLVEIDICKLIPETLKTVDIPANIKALAACEEQMPSLNLDPAYMRRILTNLVINAIQAMPNGGKLTVRTYKQDNQVIIVVEDTGMGISDEIKPRLFTPLFTTKAKGQGFGLPVVKRMIEALGGTISFESELGKGTKFIINLPAAKP